MLTYVLLTILAAIILCAVILATHRMVNRMDETINGDPSYFRNASFWKLFWIIILGLFFIHFFYKQFDSQSHKAWEEIKKRWRK